MANKIKKVSVNSLEKAVSEHATNDLVEKEWGGISFVVKPLLSFKEMLTFVDGVVKSCFTPTDGTYIPEIKDFAIRCSIIEIYANLSMPSNVEKRYSIACGCDDLIDTIMSCVNKRQFHAMIEAIDEKIEHTAEANISDITSRINDVYTSFAAIENQFADIFGNVNKDDIGKMVSSLTNGGFSENAIVKAIYEEKAKGGDS